MLLKDYKKQAIEANKHLLDEPYSKLYDILGYDNLVFFLNNYGGSNFYILIPKTAFRNCYVAQIKKDFDGANYQTLASSLDLSVRTVRYILDTQKIWN